MGLLLQSHRKLNGQHYRVSAIKIDPYVCYANENLSNVFDRYLNKSAGNMSPHEHGEVYVTKNTKSPNLTGVLKRGLTF